MPIFVSLQPILTRQPAGSSYPLILERRSSRETHSNSYMPGPDALGDFERALLGEEMPSNGINHPWSCLLVESRR
jgi:hypothetical protein